MTEEPPPSITPSAKWALALSFCGLVIFVAGLLNGGSSWHSPGEEQGDMIAFVLCRIISPVFAVSGWLTGFVAVLRHSSGSNRGAITVMVLILTFLLLFYYSAWRGTAAFHPTH